MGTTTHLYELLVALSGEDSDGMRKELDRLIAKLGLNPAHLTEDDVRQVVALYLEEIHIDTDVTDTIDDGISEA